MPNTVPADGEAMPKIEADPLADTINTFRQGWASYATIEDDAEAEAACHLWETPKAALVGWSDPATSHESAIAALRLAADEIKYGDSDIMGPMVQAALGYFDNLASANPWDKSRRLMKELSALLEECSDGLYAVNIFSVGGGRFECFLKRLPSEDDPETAVDRVDRLAAELSDALSQWAGGSYQAMVQPSNLAGHSVFFVKAGPWSGRMAV